MELQSLSRPSEGNSLTRRAWLWAPVLAVGSIGLSWLTRTRRLPNAAENGLGDLVTLVLFSDRGSRLETVRLRKIVKPASEWRKQLDSEAFSVTRRQGTEFAFHDLYWNNQSAGIYRCVCCGNALFRSQDKFDSGTGWPSFTKPIAVENVGERVDASLGMERNEVVCCKCDGHLGHLFSDGPAPSYRRFCLNSAALRFIAF